jgi:hypothetical protein
MLAILDSRTMWDPTANAGAGGMVSAAGDVVDINALLPMNRVGLTDTFTYNMTTGLEGEIPGIGWTWEAFVSHGEAETTSQMKGFPLAGTYQGNYGNCQSLEGALSSREISTHRLLVLAQLRLHAPAV